MGKGADTEEVARLIPPLYRLPEQTPNTVLVALGQIPVLSGETISVIETQRPVLAPFLATLLLISAQFQHRHSME